MILVAESRYLHDHVQRSNLIGHVGTVLRTSTFPPVVGRLSLTGILRLSERGEYTHWSQPHRGDAQEAPVCPCSGKAWWDPVMLDNFGCCPSSSIPDLMILG